MERELTDREVREIIEKIFGRDLSQPELIECILQIESWLRRPPRRGTLNK